MVRVQDTHTQKKTTNSLKAELKVNVYQHKISLTKENFNVHKIYVQV